MIIKPLKIYYFASAHWDREWYKTFQGFRFQLIKTMNEVVNVLEDIEEFKAFILDGQTVLLEDFLEIEPIKRGALEELIKNRRLLVGPWYTMPDEFLVSAESIVYNLVLGHKIAKQFGSEAMKYGYVCDVFGHIAQLPQILKGFGISGALLGRGTNDATCPSHFIWESLDGSRCTTFKVPEDVGYGTFWYNVLFDYLSGKDHDKNNLVQRACNYIEKELLRSNVPIVVLMDGMDHESIHPVVVWLLKQLESIYQCKVVYGNPTEMILDLNIEIPNLPVKHGELNETAQQISKHNMLITNTLSSRYDLKLQNDRCQMLLEKWAHPIVALASLYEQIVQPSYIELAYKYLLKNHAHDSICGCSIDEVHKDMHYRFRQCSAIAEEVVESSLSEHFELMDKTVDSDFKKIMIYNPLPFSRNETISIDVDFDTEYKFRFHEQMGYESKNAFKIFDCEGREIEYNLISIKRSSYIRKFGGNYPVATDLHKIAFTAELPSMGYSEYTLVPSDKPVRYLKEISLNSYSAENEFLYIEINNDGTIHIKDKKNNKEYNNLLSFLDDGELGDGWFHVNPVNDRLVASRGSRCVIEKIDDGPAACTFRVILYLEVPEEVSYFKDNINRSIRTTLLKIVTTLTLGMRNKWLDVTTIVENTAKDHRLRLCLPTGINSSYYYANQAFAFIKRKTGFDRNTGSWKEHASLEKAFGDIVLKQHEDGSGIAFISAGGMHECAVSDDKDGSIFITLFRSFGKTFLTDGQPDGQLKDYLTFKYRLQPFDSSMTFADLIRSKDALQAGVRSYTEQVPTNYCAKQARDSFTLNEGNIVLSLLKIPENQDNKTVIARFVNYSDFPSSSIFNCPQTIVHAVETDLLENEIGNVNYRGKELEVILLPWKIQTCKIIFE